MHISEKIAEFLVSQGWFSEGPRAFSKVIVGFAPAGTIGDGSRNVLLRLCPIGRYLERFDRGLGKVVKDVDLRNYSEDAEGAIKEVLAR